MAISAQVVSGLGIRAVMLLQEFSTRLPWPCTELVFACPWDIVNHEVPVPCISFCC